MLLEAVYDVEWVRQRKAFSMEALARPDEFVSKGGQAGAASLFPVEQRNFKKVRPLLDEIPGVPVGQLRPLRGAADLPGDTDFVQQVEHDQHR